MEQCEKYQELEIIYDKLSDEYDKKILSDEYNSFQEAWNATEDLRYKLWEISSEMRLLKKPEFESIPEYGDHITLENFIYYCKNYTITSNDGCGYYATETEMTDISISPNDILRNKYRKDFTHVIWFNK